MKQELNYTSYIDRYLDGTMGDSELKWFLKELEGNPQLQEDLRLHKQLGSVLSDQKTMDLHMQLETIHNDLFGKEKKENPFLTKRKKPLYIAVLSVAASLLLVVMVSKINENPLGDQEIYSEFYKPADMGMVFRTANNEKVNKDLRSAMSLYEDKKYSEAIRIFENILKSDSSRIGLNLYSGISHMEIKEYEEANKRFNRIIEHKANAFIESANWYLALCYLMTEDADKAKDLFEEISGSNSYYKKEARRILKKMSK